MEANLDMKVNRNDREHKRFIKQRDHMRRGISKWWKWWQEKVLDYLVDEADRKNHNSSL